mmetsp:Transcript_145524/g.466377  ORF Transcript_145524/g.466377 Transcript_145524/m.466377 type:complete len:219 (+) Transcript_145524:2584-3240(+)
MGSEPLAVVLLGQKLLPIALQYAVSAAEAHAESALADAQLSFPIVALPPASAAATCFCARILVAAVVAAFLFLFRTLAGIGFPLLGHCVAVVSAACSCCDPLLQGPDVEHRRRHWLPRPPRHPPPPPLWPHRCPPCALQMHPTELQRGSPPEQLPQLLPLRQPGRLLRGHWPDQSASAPPLRQRSGVALQRPSKAQILLDPWREPPVAAGSPRPRASS